MAVTTLALTPAVHDTLTRHNHMRRSTPKLPSSQYEAVYSLLPHDRASHNSRGTVQNAGFVRSALAGSRRGAEGGHRAGVSDDADGKPHMPGNWHAEGLGGDIWGEHRSEAGNLAS